jgi:hypothetical protein
MDNSAADPLFQLNTVLWMLQPLPDARGATRPVLHHAGYRVRALGKKLTVPAGVERLLVGTLNLRGAPEPDVLASAPPADPWLVIECKASSFGTDSSTRDQAMKIIARARDLSLVGGSPPGADLPGHVVYVTRGDQAADLQATLHALAARVAGAGLDPAGVGTLGIDVERGVGVVVDHVAGSLPAAAAAAFSARVVVLEAAGPEEDARPLYLVPYDPGVTQTDEECARCLRILLARARAHAASLIGRSPAPGTAVIEGDALLDGATFGLSRFWRDTGARDKAAYEALRFVKASLHSVRRSSATFVTDGTRPRRVEVLLTSDDHRQECAEAIMARPLPGAPRLPEFIEEELPFADLG